MKKFKVTAKSDHGEMWFRHIDVRGQKANYIFEHEDEAIELFNKEAEYMKKNLPKAEEYDYENNKACWVEIDIMEHGEVIDSLMCSNIYKNID